MTNPNAPKIVRTRLPLPYIGLWAVLASVSAGYLALMAVHPELAQSLLPATSAHEDRRLHSAVSLTMSGLGEVKQAITEIQHDVQALRNASALQDEREKGLLVRVITLETAARAPEATASLPDASDPAVIPPAPVKAAAPPTAKPASKAAGAEPTARPKAAKSAEVARPAMTTGGIETSAAAKTVPPAAAKDTISGQATGWLPKPPVAVRIAAGPSLDALRLSWMTLQEANASTLKPLQPRYQTTGKDGSKTFNLLAGPVGSAEDAERLCDRLRAKSVPCGVAPFQGEPL